MRFRKDINGLRALAVIAVVLFHFNASWMPGGFAGVDVFFVISGFLMTGIIFRGMEQDNFSVLNFYVARANRIIPALALLCLALLFFGWFYLTPLEYKALGKHAASSVGFLSNFVYWKEAGYFDAASHEKWLLHTWSLSVEWQFYVIYPLVLLALRRFLSIKKLKLLLIVGTVLGFIFSAIATYKSPNAAYYLFPTRAWEMMIGGVAYLYPFALQENRKKLVEWTGLILVIASYFLISAENLWPGYLAIFPVLGSFLIIQAQRNDSAITGNIIFQKIGTWSYSIYLWHWPFVVAIYTFYLSNYYIYIGMVLSVLLGFLSYKYVEKINFSRSFPTLLNYLKCKPIYIAGIVGVLGSGLFVTNGFEQHYSDNVLLASNEANNKNPYNCMADNKFPCYIGKKDNIKAIVVGDSHADALTTSLASVYDLKTEGIVALTKASCPFILNIQVFEEEKCLEENIKRMEFLKNNYASVPIFWVARTGVYIYGQLDPSRIKNIQDTQPLIYFTEKYTSVEPALLGELEKNLNTTIREAAKNRPIYLVLPTPEMTFNVPRVVSKELLLGNINSEPFRSEELYLKRNEPIIEIIKKVGASNNVRVLDPTDYLCDSGKCNSLYKGRPIYYDGDHMSEYGNKLLTPMFESALLVKK
ncbi:acyltransferase [Psychrobacter sp. 28M-43]|uniref:acyltransferase family protein n=1 Tax=Psychrobacter sp. 28M-43 TaxID=2772254 RepID=UPI00168D4682|nr:acyltransferase family protein [Psychrobacter sp. 28M-43]QOD11776.1 acyltransferase [Psychrobacter sp. 28M-43]